MLKSCTLTVLSAALMARSYISLRRAISAAVSSSWSLKLRSVQSHSLDASLRISMRYNASVR